MIVWLNTGLLLFDTHDTGVRSRLASYVCKTFSHDTNIRLSDTHDTGIRLVDTHDTGVRLSDTHDTGMRPSDTHDTGIRLSGTRRVANLSHITGMRLNTGMRGLLILCGQVG